jgi:hypothetical protein
MIAMHLRISPSIWIRRASAFLVAILAYSFAGAGELQDFRDASADAAKKFHPGYEYIIKFEDWISNATVEALEACGSYPNTNLTCDIVFIIGVDGRIKRTLFGLIRSEESLSRLRREPLPHLWRHAETTRRFLGCSDSADRRAPSHFESRSAVSDL